MPNENTVPVVDNASFIAEIERLKAENAALKAQTVKPAGKLTLKVSEKGGVSLYGLMRFPVTLYKSQWIRLLGFVKEIEAFLAEHAAELKEKPQA